MSDSFRWLTHSQTWAPALLGVLVLVNRFWFGKRLPSPEQCFRILVAIFGLLGAAPMWWDAVKRDDTMSGWAEMLGFLAVAWLAIESAWQTLVVLVRRSPLPLPLPPPARPPKPRDLPSTSSARVGPDT